MVSAAACRTVVAWLAFVGWLGWRTVGSGLPVTLPGLSIGSLVFFYVDASWLPLLLAVLLWQRTPPCVRDAWLATAALSAVTSVELWRAASDRYVSGASRAWDLANYGQPLWRAAHGLSMASATYDGRPIWGDHGAFAMFVFAPFTRLMDHAASGLFVVQSLLAGASLLCAFGLSRALGLSTSVGLAATTVLASSRALAQAARFDFHPECALPVVLLGLAWAHARGRTATALILTVIAVSLRDVAALTVGMLWLYWAAETRSLRALAVASAAFAVAGLDMFLLPRWTGWQAYLTLHGSQPLDLPLAASTTALRSLSTFGLGWLHPIAWVTGAPWIAAAAVSPKLLVKGIDFQYSFLFVPVATLGALSMLALVARKKPAWLTPVLSVWVALAVSVNAPRHTSWSASAEARRALYERQIRLRELVPEHASVAADPCAAPYVMERADLTLLCRLDGDALEKTGIERWEEPVPNALEATHLVVREDCGPSGPCVREQVRRSQAEAGFVVVGRDGPFVVLRRPAGDAVR